MGGNLKCLADFCSYVIAGWVSGRDATRGARGSNPHGPKMEVIQLFQI